MSDVLARSYNNGTLITGLTNIQAVRTADIADIKAVCFVRGKHPEASTIELAKEKVPSGLPYNHGFPRLPPAHQS